VGGELRGPTIAAPILGTQLPGLCLKPVFGADFKSFEELSWNINTNVVTGLEWSKAGADHRFRLLVNYYYGYSQYGQFFAQKVEMVGLGLFCRFRPLQSEREGNKLDKRESQRCGRPGTVEVRL
jgi:hypothetical protein